MQRTFPGTTIEVSRLEKGSSKTLFDGLFAAGGITLSQVSVMTALEPYMIQNWVKRGFLTSPVRRMYGKDQFARIAIINMLKDCLQLDTICNLLRIMQGDPKDRGSSWISDELLYHIYVDMLTDPAVQWSKAEEMKRAADVAAENCEACTASQKGQLSLILQVMLQAHFASQLRMRAEETLARLQ